MDRSNLLLWHTEITAYRQDLGFVPMPKDPCRFKHSKKADCFVAMHVDELLLTAPTEVGLEWIEDYLKKRYTLKGGRRATEIS
jgi:hypothetical protein